MGFIHHHYDDRLWSTFINLRKRRERFERLLGDDPTGIRVDTRHKAPEADLKRNYALRLGGSTLLGGALVAALFLTVPIREGFPLPVRREQIVLAMENIPETRQLKPTQPVARPSVPISVEDEDTPDDVTIEATELDLDRIPIDLPPPPPARMAIATAEEEEVLEVWAVEERPTLINQVVPEYPREARAARVEGSVFLKVLIGSDGKVEQVDVLSGEGLLRRPAKEAAYRLVFRPAYQNDKAVKVWMVIPVEFRLNS